MKKLVLFSVLIMGVLLLKAQDGPKTFSYQEGDTTYVMQQYYMVFLKKGEQRDLPKEDIERIQLEHPAHLEQLAKAGKVSIAGPFDNGDGDLRGVVIFNTDTREEAERLANADPAVKAGRLRVELIPWWAAKGSVLK